MLRAFGALNMAENLGRGFLASLSVKAEHELSELPTLLNHLVPSAHRSASDGCATCSSAAAGSAPGMIEEPRPWNTAWLLFASCMRA